jgi:hypothetical protein
LFTRLVASRERIKGKIIGRALMAAAQRFGVQLPAPGERINKSLLDFKMRPILSSAASGAGQLQRRVGRQLGWLTMTLLLLACWPVHSCIDDVEELKLILKAWKCPFWNDDRIRCADVQKDVFVILYDFLDGGPVNSGVTRLGLTNKSFIRRCDLLFPDNCLVTAFAE